VADWQPRCRTLFVDGGAPVDMTWDWEWDLHGCLFHAGAANFPQQHRFHQKAKKEKEKETSQTAEDAALSSQIVHQRVINYRQLNISSGCIWIT